MKTLMILEYTPGAVRISEEQARLLFTEEQIAAGEQRGHVKAFGPWHIPLTYTALCTSNEWNSKAWPLDHGPLHVYGKRVLYGVRQEAHSLHGRVKVNGKAYRGFTSSQLFELPDGKLINAATIHACGAAA